MFGPTFGVTFGVTFAMTFKGRRQVICFVAIAGSGLVGRVSAALLPCFAACRPFPFIPDHSPRVDRAVFSPGEYAGVFELPQQPGNLFGGTAGHASELFVRDRFAGRVLEVAPAAALEEQTEHVYPEASRFKRDGTERLDPSSSPRDRTEKMAAS